MSRVVSAVKPPASTTVVSSLDTAEAEETSVFAHIEHQVLPLFMRFKILLIRDIVQQALATGYLTIPAQEQLRQLLQTTKYAQEDINAFMRLQKAAMDGQVLPEKSELIRA